MKKYLLKIFSEFILVNIFMSFFLPIKYYSQNISPEFEHLSTQHGLSQSTVTAILQDSRGFLWVGTKDGLNRYDGYNFKIFRNDPGDQISLSDNSVTAITEDVFGDIWIGTLDGYINKYNYETGKVTPYKVVLHPLYPDKRLELTEIPSCFSYFENSTITSLLCDKFDNLWVGTWGKGLLRFELNEEKFLEHYYKESEEKSISSDFISSIIQDKVGTVFISTFGGGVNQIIREQNKKNNSENIYSVVHLNLPIDDKTTSLLYDDNKKNIWAGTFSNGLYCFDAGKLDSASTAYKKNILPGKSISRLVQDKDSVIWIGTLGDGLFELSQIKDSIKNYRYDSANPNSINDDDVTALSTDNNGLIWIGTASGFGLNKLHSRRLKFDSYFANPLQKNTLTNNIVTSFTEDYQGNIWIGTYKGGVNKYIKKEKKFINFTYSPDNINSISGNHITALCCDNDNNVWIGTYDAGLSLIDTKQNKVLRFTKGINSISDNRITSIVKDISGNIWIGTSYNGIDRITESKKGNYSFNNYRSDTLFTGSLSDNRISLLYSDKNGEIWVALFNGDLFKWNEGKSEFVKYKVYGNKDSQKDIRINCLYDDSEGNLWIGTNRNGVFRLIKQTNKTFKQKLYQENNTAAIAGDNKGNLWIGSYNGIAKYNYKQKLISYFNLSDGLNSMQLNNNAVLTAKDGEIFFGGVNGATSFYPDKIEPSDIIPEVRITSIQSSGNILENIPSLLNIPDDNSIGFEFSSFDFTDPSKNQYVYKLAGYDTAWTLLSNGINSTYYKNLPSGEYIFYVKGSNHSGIWSKNQAYIKLIVAAPFWKTWWFIGISILLLCFLAGFIVYTRIIRLMEVVELKRKISADLHDTVGSGLTEISLLSELMLNKNIKEENRNQIEIINERSRELVDNMSDIVWLVNPKPDSIYDLVLRLKDIYCMLFEAQGIKFKIIDLELLQDIKLTMLHRQNIYLIFKEAINNALKYSRCKNINLFLKISGSSLEVILKDDGKGFAKDKVSSGNGLKNMRQRANALKGSLEILTFPNEGTEITLRCKI